MSTPSTSEATPIANVTQVTNLLHAGIYATSGACVAFR